MKYKKNVVIGILVIVILLMAVGYSAFATHFDINGTAEITGEWDVKITNIETQEISEGCDDGNPQYTNTTATFNAKLKKPGDIVTYAITVTNAGTIDAKLNNVLFKEEDGGSEAISYETTPLMSTLKSGEESTFLVKLKYNQETTEVPEIKTKTITGIVEYVQE